MLETEELTIEDGFVVEIFPISKKTIYEDDYADLRKEADEMISHKHADVEIRGFAFNHCTFFHFPKADVLLKDKENYDCLDIWNSKLSRITSLDLMGFSQLIYLAVRFTDIDELPGNLFTYTPNLYYINFDDNKINAIGPKILDPLKDLKYFSIRRNPGIDVCYHHMRSGKAGHSTLTQLKEAIKRCKPMKLVWKLFDARKKEIAGLKKEIKDQTKDIEGYKREINELKRNQEQKGNEFTKEIEGLKRICADQSLQIFTVNKDNEALKKELEEVKQKKAFQKFDFTVKINEKEFKVQKELLTANSPVFAKLIRDNEDAEKLELKDISEEVFEEILNFMHSKQPPKETSNFMELYAVSGRLQMKELMDLCAEKLMFKVTPENAFKILNLSKKNGNLILEKKAFNELKKSYEK